MSVCTLARSSVGAACQRCAAPPNQRYVKWPRRCRSKGRAAHGGVVLRRLARASQLLALVWLPVPALRQSRRAFGGAKLCFALIRLTRPGQCQAAPVRQSRSCALACRCPPCIRCSVKERFLHMPLRLAPPDGRPARPSRPSPAGAPLRSAALTALRAALAGWHVQETLLGCEQPEETTA